MCLVSEASIERSYYFPFIRMLNFTGCTGAQCASSIRDVQQLLGRLRQPSVPVSLARDPGLGCRQPAMFLPGHAPISGLSSSAIHASSTAHWPSSANGQGGSFPSRLSSHPQDAASGRGEDDRCVLFYRPEHVYCWNNQGRISNGNNLPFKRREEVRETMLTSSLLAT